MSHEKDSLNECYLKLGPSPKRKRGRTLPLAYASGSDLRLLRENASLAYASGSDNSADEYSGAT